MFMRWLERNIVAVVVLVSIVFWFGFVSFMVSICG